jgi:branched-subunit amino acid transport protein
MTDAWLAVTIIGVSAMLMKAAGPVAIGGRELPQRAAGLVAALAPALLAALIVTQVFGGHRKLVLDARALGIGAAALLVWLRAPVLLVVVASAAVTAAARAVS